MANKNFIIAIIFLFFSQFCLSQTSLTAAGSTDAEFTVSLSGGGIYNLPISTPPGIKNVSPNVALTYNTQTSNGIVGWGWNISGLSTISRTSSTLHHDGEIDGIDIDEMDKFTLDGQRLVLKSGVYGQDGSEYVTETYNNIKVRGYGYNTFYKAPDYFIVFYPDGARSWFGGLQGQGLLEWAITKKQDAQGNTIDYTYNNDNGLLNIDVIRYGSNTNVNYNEIKFHYRDRVRKELIYVNDFELKRTKILDRVEVKGNGQLYRKYVISNFEMPFGYERVRWITEYNGQGDDLNSIDFEYDNDTNDNVIAEHGPIAGYNYQQDVVLTGDFNGDNELDFVKYNKNTKTNFRPMYKNSAYPYGGFGNVSVDKFDEAIVNTVIDDNGRLLAKQGVCLIDEDIDSNGITSSVKFKTYYGTHPTAPINWQELYTKTWTTSTYNYENTPTNTVRKKIPKKYISGDFNGDGLTDVLAIGTPYINRDCYEYPCRIAGKETTIGIERNENETIEDFEFRKQKANEDFNQNVNTLKAPPFDINDGFDNNNSNCYSCYTYTVQNRGVNFIDLNRNLTSNFTNFSGNILANLDENDRVLIGDYNGDGKTDLFHFKEGIVYIYNLDSNNQLVEINTITDSYIKMNRPILLGDYNGDGNTDFLIPKENASYEWKYFLSKGKNINSFTKILFRYDESGNYYGDFHINGLVFNSPFIQYHYVPFDFNGDGKTDIVKHARVTSDSHISLVDSINYYASSYDDNDGLIKTELTKSSFHNSANSSSGSAIGVFGTPLIVRSPDANKTTEYAFYSKNGISSFKYRSYLTSLMTMTKITNNGLVRDIEYMPLDPLASNGAYYGYANQVYPYVNINLSPSVKLISKVTENGGGITRAQSFQYTGAVSHTHGLGFLGFSKIKKTNFEGDGVQRIWSITDYDPLKRGAATRSWTSLSPDNFPSNAINKTEYIYQTTTNNNVFINVPIQIDNIDNLSGVSKTKTISYDSFYNPLSIVTNFSGGVTKTVNNTYSNNSSALDQSYHIGRVTSTVESNTINGNTFNTEEQFVYTNNLLTQFKKRANSSPWITELSQYDTFGNLKVKTIQAPGVTDRVESYDYDPLGRYIVKSTDVEGLETNFVYDNKTGNLLQSTNPFGLVNTYEYDGWQRLIKDTNYLGIETTYTYEPANVNGYGGFIKTTNYDQGQDTKEYYNTFGWLVKKEHLTLNNKWVSKETIFDAAGREIRISEPYFSTDSATQWNYYYFDEYGRHYSQLSYTGEVINTTYNGLTVTVDDGTKVISKTSNAIGNVVTATDPGGTIHYQYHGNGEMKSAIYDNHTVSTTIDQFGRRSSLSDPSAGNYTYTYNLLGEITQEVGPKGVTNYEYDDFGKTLSKQIVGDNTNLDLQYSYDPITKLVTSISGNDLENNDSYYYNYEYDSYNRLYRTKELTGSNKFIKEVSFDSYGRIEIEKQEVNNLSTGVNSIVETKNIYDASGILREIKDRNTGNGLWYINTENARQQALSISLGNQIQKTKQYDTYGFLTNIYDSKPQLTPPGSPSPDPIIALKMDYSFNAVTNTLNSRKNYAFSNWDEAFTFDNLDRLTSISGAVNHSQSYDNRGRITNNSFIGDYVYDANSTYQLSEVDLNDQGDLYYQQHSLQQITYNAFKKPVSVFEEDKGRVDFKYGPLMNRTHAYYGGLSTNLSQRKYHKKYSSIMAVEVIENYEDDSTKIITYIGGDAYTAPIAYIKDTGNEIDEYHYLHRDYLGSILAVSNSNTEIVEQSQFGAWGVVDKFVNLEGSTKFGHESLLGRGFTGHEHFFEVSLIHMNGRMYDAKLGRFLSPDNFIQDPYYTQSFNRYGYVWNNPLSNSDPTGEFIVPALIGAGIAILVNGISNSVNGVPFFRGAVKAGITGAITGVFAFGIGEAVSGIAPSITKVAYQAIAHGHLGAIASWANGGSFGAGFLSGALGSVMAHNTGRWFKGASGFWRTAGTIGSGGVSGGIGSAIVGGKFWDGVRNGIISSTLNHYLHKVAQDINEKSILFELLRSSGIDPKKAINWRVLLGEGKLNEYVRNMISKFKYLKDYHEGAGSPEVRADYPSADEGGRLVGHYFNKKIWLYQTAFSSNFRLVSTLFHEITHVYQSLDATLQPYLLWKYDGNESLVEAHKEVEAYNFQLRWQDTSVYSNLTYQGFVEQLNNFYDGK